jgi:hypothetical protein
MKLWPASRRPGGQSRHQESTPVEQAPAHHDKAIGMGVSASEPAAKRYATTAS